MLLCSTRDIKGAEGGNLGAKITRVVPFLIMRAYNYTQLTFKSVEGRAVPCQPWPQKFLVSRQFLDQDTVELRPFTLTGMIKAISTNFVSMSYWRFMYFLFKCGFLETQEGCYLSWHDWRWNFYSTLKRRKFAD